MNPNLKIEDELKKLSRRMDAMQKSLDLWSGDRNILEDMMSRMISLEQALHMNREKQGEVQKDLKADIHDLQGSVEDKVDGVQKSLDNKEIIVVPKDRFGKIKKFLKL